MEYDRIDQKQRDQRQRNQKSGDQIQRAQDSPGKENAGKRCQTGSDASRVRRSQSRRRGRQAGMRMLWLVLLAGLLLGVLLGGAAVFFRAKQEQERLEAELDAAMADDERLNGIREDLSEGNTVLTTLRKYYPDDIVMYSDGRYVFQAIDREMKMHSFHAEQVEKLAGGEWRYKEGEKVISHKGIDVSTFQGDIDWKKVADDGVEYAIVRAMYRGYGSGKLVEDPQFQANVSGAIENGITTGAYVFTQAVSREEVEEEFEMLKGLLAPYDIRGPVVVDVEPTAGGTGRMDLIENELRTELVAYFCELLQGAGYRPMIYFNIETAMLLVDLKELEPYEKWFAVYNSDFYFPYAYSIWQYSDTGHVNGIQGNVDLDLVFEAEQEKEV